MQNSSGGKTALGLDTNIGALLCYMPICAVSLIYSIIVIVTDKENRLMRFHAFQSIILTVVYIILIVGIQILTVLIVGVTGSGALGAIFSLLFFVVIIAFLAAMIIGMIKGYQGQMFKFPVVGDMAEKWANG